MTPSGHLLHNQMEVGRLRMHGVCSGPHVTIGISPPGRAWSRSYKRLPLAQVSFLFGFLLTRGYLFSFRWKL